MMKQKKYNINFYELLKLTLNMHEGQQEILLNYARQIANKRIDGRRPCLIYANYLIEEHTDSGFILDINLNGAYIETNAYVEVGKSILLTFYNPFACRNIILPGIVVWCSNDRAGIKFHNILSTSNHLKSFIIAFDNIRYSEIRYKSFIESIFSKFKPMLIELFSL